MAKIGDSKQALRFVISAVLLFINLPTFADDLQHIQHNNALRVCTTGTRPPLTRYQHQKFSGIDIDKAKAFANFLNVKKITFIKTASQNLTRALNNHTCDIAMGGIIATSTRAKQTFLSDPVGTIGIVPFVRCFDINRYQSFSAIDQPNVRVVANYGTIDYAYAKHYLKNASLTVVNNANSAYWYLLQNRADVILTDTLTAAYQAQIYHELCAVNPNRPLNQASLVYLVPNDSPELLAAVNQWLKST